MDAGSGPAVRRMPEAMPTVAPASLVSRTPVRAGVPRLFGGDPWRGFQPRAARGPRERGDCPASLCHQEWAAASWPRCPARLTGRPGAVLSTLGPGVTASATGLAHAHCSIARPSSTSATGTRMRSARRIATPSVRWTTRPMRARSTKGDGDGDAGVGRPLGGPRGASCALAEPRGPVHPDLPAGRRADSAAVPVPRGERDAAVAPVARRRPSWQRAAAGDHRARSGARHLVGLGCRARRREVAARLRGGAARAGAHRRTRPRRAGPTSAPALDGRGHRRRARGAALVGRPTSSSPSAWTRWSRSRALGPYTAPVLNLTRCAPGRPRGAARGRAAAPTSPAARGGRRPRHDPRGAWPRGSCAGAAKADWDVAAVDRMPPRAARRPWRCRCGAWRPTGSLQVSARADTPGGHASPPWTPAPTCSPTTRLLATPLEPGRCLLISNGLRHHGLRAARGHRRPARPSRPARDLLHRATAAS